MVDVLIVTYPGDYHAHAVAWGLRERGHRAFFAFTGDLPQAATMAVSVSNDEDAVAILAGREITNFSKFDRVWLRRPGDPLLPSSIHPADRPSARQAWDFLCESVLRLFERSNIFCTNPPWSYQIGRQKMLQLSHAKESGLNIPDTIATNDYATVRAFIERNSSRSLGTIAKGVHTAIWDLVDGGMAELQTSRVKLEDIKSSELSLSPLRFQTEIKKRHEVRLVVIGDSMFAARLDSQSAAGASLDYRLASSWTDLGATAISIPDEVSGAIRLFQRRAGLNFGSIDFIVDTNEDWIFLETNPNGQFLWLEDINPTHKLLDAFVGFLVEGRDDFVYVEREPSLHLSDFRAFRQDSDYLRHERECHIVKAFHTVPDDALSAPRRFSSDS